MENIVSVFKLFGSQTAFRKEVQKSRLHCVYKYVYMKRESERARFFKHSILISQFARLVIYCIFFTRTREKNGGLCVLEMRT